MSQRYSQLTLRERRQIQEGLDRGDSMRAIARAIGRSASTVTREVKENRRPKSGAPRPGACRDRSWCKRVGVCADCVRPGTYCPECGARDCRDSCPSYARQAACDALNRSPWVCNGCRKARYGCRRPDRWVYDAAVAQAASDERRSSSRSGIDMPADRAEIALSRIKEGLGRGLSPYEVSVMYGDVVGVSPSTIYRWVEAGYGGLTNLELERKVGFRPRRRSGAKRPTSHTPKRSHDSFLALPGQERLSRTEMDCVCGRRADRKAVLTLYNLPCHVQLALLLERHDCDHVKERMSALRSAAPERVWDRWMRLVLTDNGEEFADEDGLGAVLGERAAGGGMRVRLYYCDHRQSQQKGSCEKNHTEIRQILEKGMFVFDDLEPADMAVLMSHANSNPRASLGGKTPLQMLRFVYGDEDAGDLMLALGIREVPRDELVLKPEILDIERERRGMPPLRRAR